MPQHPAAFRWLIHLAEGDLPWGVPVFCLGEFLRVVTHPQILKPPSSPGEALLALEGLLESPTLRILSPGPRYPELLAESVRSLQVKGNLVFDAQLVALCREYDVDRLLTADRDLSLFPEIQVARLTDPFPGPSGSER